MVFEKVRDIISEQFNISEEEITLDMSFADDLNADSLDIFQVITAIEQEFELEVSNEDAEKVFTVGDVVEFIKEQKGLD